MTPREQLRAAYARTLAMQTHLSESQRESLLNEYVEQALAPTPAPPRPVEPDDYTDLVSEPALRRRANTIPPQKSQ